MRGKWPLILTMTMFLAAGCATVPTGGYYGDVSAIGTPGQVLPGSNSERECWWRP